MGGVISGFKGMLNAGGVGKALFVVVVLALIFAFAPQFSPEELGGKIKNASGGVL